MLDNQNWYKQEVKAVFSLEGFVAWLEKQPLNSTYDFFDVGGCAVRQYLDHALGGEPRHRLLSSVFSSLDEYYEVTSLEPYTFGDCLSRARKALAERS